MSFISPMLAASMPKTPLDIRPGLYVAETKFDGHRLVVEVSQLDKDTPIVQAWSRHGLPRLLPAHIVKALTVFPVGIYDGELNVPGKRSYGVTELVNGPNLVYTVFDVLELFGVSTMAETQDRRRAYLEEIFSRDHISPYSAAVDLAKQYEIASRGDVDTLLRAIWDEDGEGLILKRRLARYVPGKRPKDAWIKMKDLKSAVLTVIGFQPSKGEIQNRGPYATVVLQDDAGFTTTVKTLNDKELDRFNAAAGTAIVHPAIGRKLRIEYQEKTPDGSYRHPRWDRWETE